MGGQYHASAALPPEWPRTYCIQGRVRPRAGLNGEENLAPQPGLDPEPSSP